MIFKLLFVPALSLLASVSFARTEPYNPDYAVNYTRYWAYGRNSSYANFDKNTADGGDCTNFASQSLQAGGFRNTATDTPNSDSRWYYVSKSQYSLTWSTANGLYNRMRNGYEGWSQWNGMDSLNYGDIVFADWAGNGRLISHTMIVTGFHRMSGGYIEPRLSYHSSDQRDITLTDFKARAARAYPNARYYRFGPRNICLLVKPYQIF